MEIESTKAERPQFSLRFLLAVIFAASFVLAMLFAVPDSVAGLVLFVLGTLSASLCIAGIVYCRGATRAFCVGACGPLAIFGSYTAGIFLMLVVNIIVGLDPWIDSFAMYTEIISRYALPLKFLSITTWLLAAISGIAAVAIRRFAR